jgi:arylsulfatase A
MITAALAAAAAASPMSFVVIFLDDAGYGDFGFAGHPTIRTPRIDQMAHEGAVFTQFVSASPACTASRYSLLTGKYPIRSGFNWVLNPDSPRYLHPQETTIAEALKAKGYRTGIFGKWHLGAPNEKNGNTSDAFPLAHGFDEWLGFPYSNDMLPEKGYPDLDLIEGQKGEYRTIERNPNQDGISRRITDRAVSFIGEAKSSPYFCYIPHPMPHVPLHPSDDKRGRSARGLYGDVMEDLDQEIGRVLDAVRKSPQAENTLVVLTSDNGPWIIKGLEAGSSGLFRDGKGSTWEGGVRVPGIFWQPARIPAGRRLKFGGAMDVAATLADFAGAKLPPQDGQSLRPDLEGRTGRTPRSHLYYGVNNRLFALRQGPWKLHIDEYSQTGQRYFGAEPRPLLFNLDEDPSERMEVSEANPSKSQSLQASLQALGGEVAAAGSYWDAPGPSSPQR